MAAYIAYQDEITNAERHPSESGNTAAIERVTLDPEQAELFKSITELQEDGLAWTGSPPQVRAHVTTVKPGAKPYPKASVRDCPSLSKSWQVVYVNSGKAPESVPTKGNEAQPPYAITATLLKYHGRWMVQETTVDKKQTCKP